MSWRRFFGVLAAGFGLALAIAAVPPAKAAPVTISLTALGKITSGSDYDGSLTGGIDLDLSDNDLDVMLVQTYVFDSSALPAAGSDPASVLIDDVTLSITVGAGPALVFSSAPPAVGFGLYTITSLAGGPPASIDSQAFVQLASGAIVGLVMQVVDNALDLGSVPPDLLQDFSFNVMPAGGTWTAGGSATDDQFNPLWDFLVGEQGLASLTIDVTRAPTGVPEPGSLAALAAGAGALFALRRRRALRTL